MYKNIVREIGLLNRSIKNYINNGNDPREFLNVTQLRILNYLLDHESDDVCQKDLELETRLKKASITGCLDTLVDRDLIKRVQADDDKRKNYIKLTEKALYYKNEFNQREVNLNNSIIKNISEKELDVFYEVIRKIKENVDREESR